MKTKPSLSATLAVLVSLTASSLMTGCAAMSIERRSVDSPPRQRLVRPETEATLAGEFRYEAGAVVGQLAWANACRREEVRETTAQSVAVKPVLAKPLSITLLSIGAAFAVGGIYTIANAGKGDHADYRSCSDPSNDECKSPRQLLTEAGTTLLVLGAAMGGTGVAGLVIPPKMEPLGTPAVVDRRVRTLDARAACGEPGALGGITLGVSPLGAEPSLGTTDEHGALRIAFGERALGSKGGRLPVGVVEVPEALRAFLPLGTVVGDVSVPPPPVEAAAPRRGIGARGATLTTSARSRPMRP
jgi:hypothetical protein